MPHSDQDQIRRVAAYTDMDELKDSERAKMGPHTDLESGEDAFGVKKGSRVYAFLQRNHVSVTHESIDVVVSRLGVSGTR